MLSASGQMRMHRLAVAARPRSRAGASSRLVSATALGERSGQQREQQHVVTHDGAPEPLGPTPYPIEGFPTGVNFALWAGRATSVTLVLFFDESMEASMELPLTARTGEVWHILVEGIPMTGVRYGFKVNGDGGWETGARWEPEAVLLDPYAPLVEGRQRFADRSSGEGFLGSFDFASAKFNWGEGYERPNIREEDLIVYEMNVRAFTSDPSSGVAEHLRGSYLGVKEKIPHLKALGVNAVELLPIMEFDELEFQRIPNPRDHMVNTWGYSTISFMAPMSRYGSGQGAAAASWELKEMIRSLHAEGIEVILDVVYNHTAEMDDTLPYLLSLRGIDNGVYYMLERHNKRSMMNFSGCGNTLNANHPVVRRLILDSLRHFVEEYHVDGFRFDLASALCRGEGGEPIYDGPPLIREITHDPVLKHVKLIAEPWDCGGLYQVGSFPNWDRWYEWNGRYRDDVRSFVKGTGNKSAFATRLAGSADLYHTNNRKPFHSLNFVIAHDGFTLADLVSYNGKHNGANGEGGRDGSNDNLSWNCGHEGETGDGGVRALRARQMRNFVVALMMSQGTPMVLMGDEYGHTRHGNNNSYGHDNELNNFQWGQAEREKDAFMRFYAGLLNFRRSCPLLGRREFLTDADITWHEDRWDDPGSRFLAFTLHDRGQGGGSIYAAFNAHTFFVDAALPPPPHGHHWRRVVDTNLPSPADFSMEGEPGCGGRYNVGAFASIILRAHPN